VIRHHHVKAERQLAGIVFLFAFSHYLSTVITWIDRLFLFKGQGGNINVIWHLTVIFVIFMSIFPPPLFCSLFTLYSLLKRKGRGEKRGWSRRKSVFRSQDALSNLPDNILHFFRRERVKGYGSDFELPEFLLPLSAHDVSESIKRTSGISSGQESQNRNPRGHDVKRASPMSARMQTIDTANEPTPKMHRQSRIRHKTVLRLWGLSQWPFICALMHKQRAKGRYLYV